MSEYETSIRSEKLPLVGTVPIELITDVDYYRKKEAPPRAGRKEAEDKSRFEHIRGDHELDILDALDVKNLEEAFEKMAEISLNKTGRVAQFIDERNGNIIDYDLDTDMAIIISKDLDKDKNPPPRGEIVTAYPCRLSDVKRKIAGESRGSKWIPISRSGAKLIQ